MSHIKDLIDSLAEHTINKVGTQADKSTSAVLTYLELPSAGSHLMDKEGAIQLLSDEVICLINYAAAIAALRDAIKESE